jgi:hypothetical protein
MRRASSNVHFIIDDNKNFFGVSLGYDFTAEHEWGISRMKRYFGIDSKEMGIKSRTITKGEVFFAKDENLCLLTSHEPYKKKSI